MKRVRPKHTITIGETETGIELRCSLPKVAVYEEFVDKVDKKTLREFEDRAGIAWIKFTAKSIRAR